MNNNQMVTLTLTMEQFDSVWSAMELAIAARKGATVAPYEPEATYMRALLEDIKAQWRPQYTESIK